MLYVFIVSSGTMMKFDMNLAVKKVIELKTEIFNSVHIPVEDQVLLCSGGEELKSDNIVGNYFGAGTDTNPIFLFSKYSSDSNLLYNAHLSSSIDLSIEDDVRGCANMNPSSNAATVRAELAQKFADAAVNGRRECDELVHGQHLQQQGWAAVIANMEDAKDSLVKRTTHFEEVFRKYLLNRPMYKETIKTFPDDIEVLSKVPLLPKLMLGNECIEEDLATEHTLLSWFCSEPRLYLESLAEKCQRSLDELDEHTLAALNDNIGNVLKSANNPDIKEVKGIEDRLSLLNKQIEDAKKLEKDQRDLASWFNQTQGRISKDPQVLPDLCGTFQNQLELMLQNHKCLRDILERCTKAKLELSESINFRVKVICGIESQMYDLQVRIIFLEKHVRSVMSQIESFRQVHMAPQRYLKMLAEVCRRKVFSSNFIKWATDLSAQAFKLYEKEISLRSHYTSDTTKNMVDNLFPGMDDVPPPFAIECPRPFDQNLPNIVKEDLELLRIRFPELSHFCEVPLPDPMPFVSQADSDSAFSSNVPSSRVAGDSANLGHKSLHEKEPTSPHKLAAPSGDYSSLPSEFASLPNEVFSLTSSPFEDPLSHAADLELASKRTNTPPLQAAGEIKVNFLGEERAILESDGEEFETVERYRTSPIEICPQPTQSRRRVSAPRPTSTSDVIAVNKSSEYSCPKVSKARSDGDALSPMQERLKSSDSLVVSGDYYFDDSMPSSCTESNATSPLLRANKMVKTHHVVVAELQKQVEEKNGALIGATRFIQELQGFVHSEQSNLKAFVNKGLSEMMADTQQTIKNVNAAMVELQQRMHIEKTEELNKIQEKYSHLESTYLQRLEVESQKLNDSECQIVYYEDHLTQLSESLAELRHENKQMEEKVLNQEEKIKSLMLEHELELDSLRNQLGEKIQDQEDSISTLTEDLLKAQKTIKCLNEDKQSLEDTAKEKDILSANLLLQKEADFCEKLKDMHNLQEEIKRLQDMKDSCKTSAEMEAILKEYEEKNQSLKLELEEAQNALIVSKKQSEKCKEQEMLALEEKHKHEIESLRSRYRLAVSTTSLERLPVNANSETLESEQADIGVEDSKKAVSEQKESEESEEVGIANLSAEYEELKSRHEGLKNYIEKLKSRNTAENQVSFNKAINRLTKEKDAVINELRARISVLEAKNAAIKAHLDSYTSSCECLAETGQATLSQSETSTSKCFQVSEVSKVLSKLKNEMEPFFQLSDSLSVSSDNQDSVEFLQKKLKLKEEEFERLTAKFVNIAGSSTQSSGSCIDCSYKISVLSCDVGDLILLCYEEKHENFAVFHFGHFIHFLHPDSLQTLNLRIPAGPSVRWAIGVVVSKEFCVTRKPNNRYKVTLGTKFYRVKVKPWDREKAYQEYQLYRSKMESSTHSSGVVQRQSSEDGSGPSNLSQMSASAI